MKMKKYEVVLQTKCDETDTNEDGKEATKNCEDRVEELKVGMAFNSSDDAYLYYKNKKGLLCAEEHQEMEEMGS